MKRRDEGVPPVALVTGASRGIGLAISASLASRGWRLVTVSRDGVRLRDAMALLAQHRPDSVLSSHAVDLAELSQVRALAAELLDAGVPLRCLVHNAGVICMHRELTSDALERTWATNVVAPHLLTRLLQPLLPENDLGRVIFMSSLVRRWGSLLLEDPGFETGYTADKAYNQSKLALVLLAQAWAARQLGWFSLCMEPGMTATDFGDQYTGLRACARALFRPFMATPEQAADTAVWLATSEASRLHNGGHYRRRQLVLEAARDTASDLANELIDRLNQDAG